MRVEYNLFIWFCNNGDAKQKELWYDQPIGTKTWRNETALQSNVIKGTKQCDHSGHKAIRSWYKLIEYKIYIFVLESEIKRYWSGINKAE